MKYLPPFDLTRRSVEISAVCGELRGTRADEDFVRLLKMMITGEMMITGAEVNAAW